MQQIFQHVVIGRQLLPIVKRIKPRRIKSRRMPLVVALSLSFLNLILPLRNPVYKIGVVLLMRVPALILGSLPEFGRHVAVGFCPQVPGLHVCNLKYGCIIILHLNKAVSALIILNGQPLRMCQLVHVLVQIVNPSPLGQLQQTLLQVSQDPFLQQHRFSRIQLEN